jgi:hypothetical protein
MKHPIYKTKEHILLFDKVRVEDTDIVATVTELQYNEHVQRIWITLSHCSNEIIQPQQLIFISRDEL